LGTWNLKKMRYQFCVLMSALALLSAGVPGIAAERPNILMIMVDDLGFSDVGCYGGEIETPNLDSLAGNGIRFSQFYNTAKCHSSRVSLLTGQYCIAAGDVSLSNAVTSAEVLRGGGYSTAMTGKWHLKQQPTDFGFDRYFGHLSGACNYFRGDNSFRLNGQPFVVPDDGFYTTVANVDYALEFLQQARETTKPWHLYVAFNAPHAPLQALPDDYAKYQGRYDAGWDSIRKARVAKQKEIGLLPFDCVPSERPEHIPAWESLTDARKTFEIKRMTTLAAMIDRVDQEIGRLIGDLRASGELDNTLIWFVSDNGACPYDRRSTKIESIPTDGTVSWSDSTGWAWARNSPFRFYKQNQFEGGICTPAIVHWPAGIRREKGTIVRQSAHLVDVMPTFADVAGANIPTQYPGRQLRGVSGQSLRPIFDGGMIQRNQPLHFLFSSDRGLRDGDWKAVSFRSGDWELYNIAHDRTERENLADRYPERLDAMVETWTKMAQDVLHAPASVYKPVGPASLPHHHPEWTNFSVDPTDGAHGGNVSAKPAGRKASKRNRDADKSTRSIRARKNTSLKIEGSQLKLQFTGEDPGLAFDQFSSTLPVGPYFLEFKLQSDAGSTGQVFWTTDPNTILPKGQQIDFHVQADNNWHECRISLPTEKRIFKLRLDVGENVGTATIDGLRLVDADGNVLVTWPQ
ncbi:MAG: arylsulfatase, partial [Planctomycetales bacterium]|nr:arylsulfatase [Planctomycetales bacterium]